ncbi:hypothetical protein [Halpernia sp. GG3]
MIIFIFGETTLAIGTLNLALAFYFWNNSTEILTSEKPLQLISSHLKPLHILFYASGFHA